MENVNHPNHYQKPGRKECIVEMEELFGKHLTAVFCLTNAYKYLYRAGQKVGNTEEQDLAKAEWYYNYFKIHLDSSINGHGQQILKLHKFIKEKLADD